MWTVSGWMWVVLCVCLLLFCCIYRGELDINGRRVTCKESATAQRTEMWEQMLPGQKFHMCVSVYQKFKFSVAWRKRVTWQAAVPDKSRLSRRLRGPISLAVLDKGQLVLDSLASQDYNVLLLNDAVKGECNFTMLVCSHWGAPK